MRSNRHLLSAAATASALLVSLPALAPRAAQAHQQTPQVLAQASDSTIRTTSAQQQTLYLNNDKTYSYALTVSQRTTVDGRTLPKGATIFGSYRPADGGLRYVAEAAKFDGQTISLNAASRTIEDEKDPRDTSAGAIAKDAGIGAAGGAAAAEVFGDIDVAEVVGGAAAGAAVGNVTADRVVVVEPDEEIVLRER